MMPDRYQTVSITLTDGRTGTFTGPELVTQGDHAAGVGIRDIKFFEARPLPPTFSFEPFPPPEHDPGCHEPSCTGCPPLASGGPVKRPGHTEGTRGAPEAPKPPDARPRARKRRKAPSAQRGRKRST